MANYVTIPEIVDSEPLLATARFSHFTDFEEPLVWVVIAIIWDPWAEYREWQAGLKAKGK